MISIKRNSKNFAVLLLRVATIVASVVVLRIASSAMKTEELNTWIISRQLLGFLTNVSMVALIATSFPRTLVAYRDRFEDISIALSAAIVSLPAVGILLFLSSYSDQFAEWFSLIAFGSRAEAQINLGRLLVALLLPWGVVLLISLFLRGKGNFCLSMAFEFCFGGLLPLTLVVMLEKGFSTAEFLYYYYFGLVALATFGVIAIGTSQTKTRRILPQSHYIIEILQYGIPKVFANSFPLVTFGLLPVVILSTTGQIDAAAGISVVATIVLPLCGVSTIQLATTGLFLLVANREDSIFIAKKTALLLQLAIFSGVFSSMLAYTSMDLLVNLLSGDNYLDYSKTIRIAGACLLLYLPISILEVPLDCLQPPWSKAKVGCLVLLIELLAILLLIQFKPVSSELVIAVIGLSMFSYCVSIFCQVRKFCPLEKILDSKLLALLCLGCCCITAAYFINLLLNGWGKLFQFTVCAITVALLSCILNRAKLLSLLVTGVSSSTSLPSGARSCSPPYLS